VWRSLSPQAREEALACAKRGVAPGDLGIAWAAAGYGRLVTRRLRIARQFVPVGLFVVAALIGAVLVVNRASPATVDVTLTLLMVLALACLFGLNVRARRFQRLYSTGLLGIEASRLGATGPSPAPSAWSVAPGESEFTVPYHAQLPLAHPAPTVVTDPVAAGVYELPVRRARLLTSLGIMSVAALLLWSMVIKLWLDLHRTTPVFLTMVTLLTLAITFFVLVLGYAVGPAMRQSVAARFTPEGWEIPSLRLRGSWAEVRAIRVRPLSTRGSAASSPLLAEARAVALIVDDPEQRIAHLSRLRRAMVQSSIKRYGSPIVIVASHRTLPVVDMVGLLRSYTSAPVDGP
jgi:hypothetical protein